jgi:putative sigma-54 modulation protein
MIKHIDISAAQKDYEIDPELAKYIQKKIGKLDKHMKRENRTLARADVKLKESTGKSGKRCTAEAILHIPGTKFTASESTINMYAAIDIVENKLQNQLNKYKQKNNPSKDKRRTRFSSSKLGKMFSR